MAESPRVTTFREGRAGSEWPAMPQVLTLALACLVVVTGPAARAAGVKETAMHHERPAASPTPDLPRLADTPLALPVTAGAWARIGEPQRIDAAAIFEYMDGAGELYLGYRFDHLDAYVYRAAGGSEILVELYSMGSSDDAFGLLSGDWGGESVVLAPDVSGPAAAAAAQWPRAKYGAGLLRLWSGNLFARVLADRESAEARDAVLALGRAIAGGRSDQSPPRLAVSLPQTVDPGFQLRRESVCFLRSHLVLNSAYFLSQQNILALDPSVEAVTARWDRRLDAGQGDRVRVILVRYPDSGHASAALARFREAYLPELQAAAASGGPILAELENGWLGCHIEGRDLALALDCPDREVAAAYVAACQQALRPQEDDHE
ncbi:MAG: DUF6599 family protein [Acidobacteriota bacterium]